MDRAELQKLAEERLADAETLLAAGRWSGAYYLAGYAVECALKSCILARLETNAAVIFAEGGKKFSQNCWTHNLEDLVKLADLSDQRVADTLNNTDLFENWGIAKDWRESSRYENKVQLEAERFCEAISNKDHGVLQWIKNHW